MQSIEGLKRKYGGSIESVIDYVEQIQRELDELSGLDDVISNLRSKVSDLTLQYTDLADRLNQKRKDFSKSLSQQIEAMMEKLNMDGATFQVEIQQKESPDETIKHNDQNVKYGPKGYDDVEFYLSANPGEAIKPFQKLHLAVRYQE